ncbi:TPA: hypothetical protein VDV84_005856 [Pseudomonas aeruginosa]|uniref:Uncharacterized protein n=1 Tax=Pseudomonas aeruginosa (strain UCBPP-PA14) TaxID=208963 RepID=A0A0H2ZJH3_PSEAB|nr:hypothetical protein PA14_72820 [Pseudomonas aeruginosa UCBPP-PA14]ALY78264.1 hypothetical protein HW03_16225 [Pseudomonas aeruginosa]EOT09925.1 hypothetical protein CIA_05130 [Pseudomonas aeruginosa PA14]ERV26947.1 hypothetical protein Q070_04517 [Pseudomonas aeruginosa BL16]ERV77640.1 hypothetical protein Q040_06160 [Pseudomonas aeruginosa BWHPSA027]ETV12576.1 hypothetical protein Q049_05764 [Pseudomonas aeruginosa BWHPSA044]EZO57338.1 hypothetical protein V559_06071 [Pseudomonas aerugin
MPAAIRILLLALAVLAGIGAAAIQAEDTPCATAAECNTRGTQAYRQGSYPQVLDAFAWQLRLAERQEQGGADSEPALNNLALTSLKAGQPGRARAWMNLALDRGYSGKATRHNLEQVALKVDYPSLQGLAGHYLRYAGQAEWESLQIEPVKGGYQASFALMRIGNPEKLMEYGPAAVGEWSAGGARRPLPTAQRRPGRRLQPAGMAGRHRPASGGEPWRGLPGLRRHGHRRRR